MHSNENFMLCAIHYCSNEGSTQESSQEVNLKVAAGCPVLPRLPGDSSSSLNWLSISSSLAPPPAILTDMHHFLQMEFRHLEHIGVSNEQKRLNIPIKRKGAEEGSVFKTQQSVAHVQGRRCARACVCTSEGGGGEKDHSEFCDSLYSSVCCM